MYHPRLFETVDLAYRYSGVSSKSASDQPNGSCFWPAVQGDLRGSASLRSNAPRLSTKNTQSAAWSHLVMWR